MAISISTTPEEEAGLEQFRLMHNAHPEHEENQMATVDDYVYFRFQQILGKELAIAERKTFDALWDDPVKRAAAIAAGQAAGE